MLIISGAVFLYRQVCTNSSWFVGGVAKFSIWTTERLDGFFGNVAGRLSFKPTQVRDPISHWSASTGYIIYLENQRSLLLRHIRILYCNSNRCKGRKSPEKAALLIVRVFWRPIALQGIRGAMLWPCPDCILPFCFYLFVNCPCGAMTCEVKLNTLQGSVITLDILMTATVRELKSMLLEKHPCQDPTERKVLKVELLRDSSIIDDAESLDEAGLVGAESLVTVTYTRNEVEAATKNDIRTQGYFGWRSPATWQKFPSQHSKIPLN